MLCVYICVCVCVCVRARACLRAHVRVSGPKNRDLHQGQKIAKNTCQSLVFVFALFCSFLFSCYKSVSRIDRFMSVSVPIRNSSVSKDIVHKAKWRT